MTDHEMIRRRLEAIAEHRRLPALPPLDHIEATARRRDRAAHRRRLTAGIGALGIIGLLAVNAIEACREISVVTVQTIPDTPAGSPAVTSGEYTAVAGAKDWVMWLAPDRSGSSRGCVSVQQRGTTPPDRLPNDVQGPGAPNTVCAPTGNQVGYLLLRLPDSAADPTGFGFAPANTDHLVLTFHRRGPIWVRLFTSEKTVRASTYGHELGLPVVGWVGPDPDGYSLTRLRAVTASGEVVGELTFSG